jgi:poly-gamma-glutamate synthesis protein (capsule biosynthesis protein)
MRGTLQDLSATARRPWDVPVYPFARVESQLKGLVFGNLEGPLTGARTHRFKPKWMRFYFKSPAGEAVAALKQGGFRVMSVANNHSMDSGEAGLRDTLAALDEGDIVAAGAGADESLARRPAQVPDGHGNTITFLAFCAVGPPGTFATRTRAGAAFADPDTVVAAVRAAARAGGTVVLSLHWGIEKKRDLPVPDPQVWQRDLAHRAIDAGAVLVLGHHPHVVGRFEEYKSGLIAYSLGNFLFSGARIRGRRKSVILHVDFSRAGVRAWNLVPVDTDPPEHPFQTQPLGQDAARAYLRQILGERTPGKYGWPAPAP